MVEQQTDLLSVSEALQQLLESFSPVDSVTVPIIQAYGRILAADITSEIDLPYFSNSSMDGYAVRASDVANASPNSPAGLKVVADIPAGTIPRIAVGENEAARIMTGAPLPEGADAVVPVENTNQMKEENPGYSPLQDEVLVLRPVKIGDYIRKRGEDIKAGNIVLERGSRLRPQDIGLLAMLGIPGVTVYRKPRVAMLSTGDELVPVDAPLTAGKIHDSNFYTLSALCVRDGADSTYLGIVPDTEEAVERALEAAVSEKVDLILSSAGVSVGAFDFVRLVVEKHGRLSFWRVNMRPGKPLAFGYYRGTPFIGLPGNPVSAFVGYEVFVRPTLMKLGGLKQYRRPRTVVRLKEKIESDGRESYLRAVVREEGGELIASLTGHQGSGNLLSLVQANALLIIPSGVKSLPSRAEVEAWIIQN
jgi:molybdopterin molybdotransferase